jgi:hypothetical protein
VKAYEAITEANELSPNQYGNDLKLRWLKDLDGRIWRELMERREAPEKTAPWPSPFDTGEDRSPTGSTAQSEETVIDDDELHMSDNATFESAFPFVVQSSAAADFDATEITLLVPEPWARDVYVNYLLSRVAQADAEAERYNLYASFFNIAYGEYAAWYNRTASLPRRGGWRY